MVPSEKAARGQVLNGRQSLWRLSIIPELFWAVVNFVVLFFQTMFQPDLTRKGKGHSSNYGTSRDGRGGPPPGGPFRRMGRINPGGGPSPPPVAGGG
uniref:Selenoprotein K n=1 Tax=Eptatretus burgeri TaxID=7764 RepID=A0A8C4R3A6_EPTBU